MAAAGPPPPVELRHIPDVRLNPELTYANRIDTAAHEAMISEARLHVERTRAAYDCLVEHIGYAPTKPDEAPRPSDWIDDFTCTHKQFWMVDCCVGQLDIVAGNWRWNRDGRRALASNTRMSVGTFPRTRSIYLKVIANANAALRAMCAYRRDTHYHSDAYKEFIRRTFITLRAAEIQCTRFVHLQAVLPVPRPAAELVWIPKMLRCTFGYVFAVTKYDTVYTRCRAVAPVKMKVHGGRHSCARHAAVPEGWMNYYGDDSHRAMLADTQNKVYLKANRLRAAKRRRVRLEMGTQFVERRRKMARRGMAARGLNDARLVDAIIAMSEMRP